ncbi:M20 family metallopeptidase [Aggregicoccus sp. 17bor-14]|uniref:Sapep family Mn(2+)-dependent dipeptidase n=1 Tax=Myxococcaceae TaxID=31 RepID=UPI00129D1344|nr:MULTISPECIES: Sapep family Mn(2+)-dependent dipeptidase [Myxococcaceae]MBF5045957.1 Sapep family Mn(2+)-dependent dipeptidase [Simulacricoccus sp. 17bor-14]MRI91689.1 M20 family metallopeptidase [Aggregicoccus sp. 17bor-14]
MRSLALLLSLLGALQASAAPAAKDPRCRGAGPARAARFLTPGQPAAPAQLTAYAAACAQDSVVQLTSQLIRFRTVSSEVPAAKSPEIARMGAFLQGWAKRNGLAFRTVGQNDVFELAWGEGPLQVGFVFHGDVVPAPAHEWKTKPFEPVVKDGKLYGRGAMDDKAPLAAVLTLIQLSNELGLKPAGRVLVIVGNGEESDWTGMQAYAEKEPHPPHVISVDANFPLVAAQSGFVGWALEADAAPAAAPDSAGAADAGTPAPAARLRVTALSGGEFLTQVPGQAELTLLPVGMSAAQALAQVQANVAALAAERPLMKVEVKRAGGSVRLVARGVAVHSSVAEEGRNALWDLAAVASRLPLEDGGAKAMLGLLASHFDGDVWGQKLGLAYEDPLMGRLLVTADLLRLEKGKVTLGINMRRPQGKDAAAFNASLDAAARRVAEATGGRVHEGKGRYVGDPHVADPSGPLVTTLLGIYRQQMSDPQAAPRSVRGGTYARLFPRAVDFGPDFPGDLYTGHAPDEFVSLERLDQLTRLLAGAMGAFAFTAPPK